MLDAATNQLKGTDRGIVCTYLVQRLIGRAKGRCVGYEQRGRLADIERGQLDNEIDAVSRERDAAYIDVARIRAEANCLRGRIEEAQLVLRGLAVVADKESEKAE